MPPGIVGTSSYSAFRRGSWDASSTSETYTPETLRDRRSVWIESETTQTGIDWAPAGSAQLTRGSRSKAGPANPTNSGLFRRVRDLLETTHCMQTAHEEHQFQRDNFRDALASCDRIPKLDVGIACGAMGRPLMQAPAISDRRFGQSAPSIPSWRLKAVDRQHSFCLGTNQDSSSCAGRPCPWRAPIEEISHLFGSVVIPLLAPRAEPPRRASLRLARVRTQARLISDMA